MVEKKIRLIELFAGIGTQAMALRDIGANFEHYYVVEYDKHAVKSYNAIHDTNFKPMDICNVSGADLNITELDKYYYIMTYSFPCTSLSIAGTMAGMIEGSGTESSLLWEVKRILSELRDRNELPDTLVMENVQQIHSSKHIKEFQKWLDFLSSIGYRSTWFDLNAADYGVPQHRVRTFCVSTLSNEEYEIPRPITLKEKMSDRLESEVSDYYFIHTEKAKNLIQQLIDDGTLNESTTMIPVDLSINKPKAKTIANCITAHLYKEGWVISNQRSLLNGVVYQLGNICPTKTRDNPNQGRVYNKSGSAPTLTGMTGGNRMPFIVDEQCYNKGEQYAIRKLTPYECWALMGYSLLDYASAKIGSRENAKKLLDDAKEMSWLEMMNKLDDMSVMSRNQMYKQAGNAIVRDCMMAVFSQLNIKGCAKWNEGRNES